MRIRLSLLGLGLALSLCTAVPAQDLPTTTDHGITITPDDLTTAIQQSQDLWGPVRKLLHSEECTIGETAKRKEALAFLKMVHDSLHSRLFEMGDEVAMDLIDYLGKRLRMYEVYRKLRTTIGDDNATYLLVDRWGYEFRVLNLKPESERPAKIAELLSLMDEQMKAAGIAAEKIVEANKLWTIQADVTQKMCATGAGKMMLDHERKGFDLEPSVGNLLADISLAADWAQIANPSTAEIGKDHFVKAWASLKEARDLRSTAAQPVINR
jgi:hypothetical protein